MALLQLGAIITKISGKVGGQSFVNGSQGTYLKNIGNHIRTGNSRQNKIRYNTAYLMRSYNSLTDLQRKTFEAEEGKYTYINRVGEVKDYNGFQIFMLLNQGRFLINEDLIKSAFAPTAFNNSVFTISDASQSQLTVIADSISVSESYVLWCTGPLKANQQNILTKLRKVSVIDSASILSGYDFTSDYSQVFTNLQQDQRLAFYVEQVITLSGQRSGVKNPFFFITTV